MNISDINNIGHAWASWERNEANKGKGVRSKGWVTKEQMRRNAAQKTLGILIVVAVLTALSAIFIKIFGKAIGALMMVILSIGLPICYLIREVYGYNVQWLPLWIVGFALLLKIFTKMFGRKWGLRVGIPVVIVIGVIAYVNPHDENTNGKNSPLTMNKTVEKAEKTISGAKAVRIGAENKSDEENEADNDESDIEMRKLERMIEANTDPSTAVLRVNKIRQKFASLKRSYWAGKRYTGADAYEGCLRYAESSGWLVKAKKEVMASTVDLVASNDKDLVDEHDKTPSINETGFGLKKAKTEASDSYAAKEGGDSYVDNKEYSKVEVRQFLKDVSARLEELLAQVRANKTPTTTDYELDSRVEYLKNMYEQELRCASYDHESLSETKAVADKAYRLISSHAYRMRWVKSEEEKRVDQEVAAYLENVSARLEGLCAQVRANKKPMTPDYELNSRAECLKGMFDQEMRFPLRDRWDSFEQAKLHADKAYKTCLEHAHRMGWIIE